MSLKDMSLKNLLQSCDKPMIELKCQCNHWYPYILWNQTLSRRDRKPIQTLMYCKFDEIQSYNWYKNIDEYAKCVRVLYHSIQTSTCSSKPEMMLSPIKCLIKVSNRYCIDWYAMSYDKNQQEGSQKIKHNPHAIQ